MAAIVQDLSSISVRIGAICHANVRSRRGSSQPFGYRASARSLAMPSIGILPTPEYPCGTCHASYQSAGLPHQLCSSNHVGMSIIVSPNCRPRRHWSRTAFFTFLVKGSTSRCRKPPRLRREWFVCRQRAKPSASFFFLFKLMGSN